MSEKNLRFLFLSSLLLCYFLLDLSPARAAQNTRAFCVSDPIAPIAKQPGLKYKEATLQKDGYYLLDDTPGFDRVVVYGNHVNAVPAPGKFADSWMEIFDRKGASLGYVPKKSLRPLPSYTPTAEKFFWTKTDAPDLFLLPGELPISSRYGFNLLRGETLRSVGVYGKPGGEQWLLFVFNTADWTGQSGVSARFAWGREGDFLRLETYKPDYSKVSPQNLPTQLRGNLKNDSGGFNFDQSTLARIAKHGFWIHPKPEIPENIMIDDMVDGYEGTAEFVPAFITMDLYFHAWHLISSRMLQKTEAKYFAKALGKYLTAALAQVNERAKRISAKYPNAPRDAIQTARDMLSLPLALLTDPESSPEKNLSPAAAMEYAKIMTARGRGISAVTGGITDYTQYKPRSHYTLTPELSRYFRAMSFLGDATLHLKTGDNREERLNASAISLLCLATGNSSVKRLGDDFNEPLRVMMGDEDDNSPRDFIPVVRKILADDEESITLPKVADALYSALLSASRSPRVSDKPAERPNMTEAEKNARQIGFRLLGKRFTFDAFAFSRLTSPVVGAENEPRNLPRPEDVMAVLGSKAAYELTSVYAEQYKNYGFNRRALIGGAASFLTSPGADTVYSSWLRTLSDSFADSGSQQFFYRGGGMWEWKKLLTASASWAELKHDTVLYAKQNGAEMGGGAEWTPGEFEPPRPRGYVEPQPQAFSRVLQASEKLTEVLSLMKKSSSQYSDGEYERKLKLFAKLCLTARDIAEKEARGLELSTDDFANIEMLSRAFTSDLLLPEGMFWAEDDANREQVKMALVTDVASDYMSETVLHVATGAPRRIFVYVDDTFAGPRITTGFVYSYYEFEREMSDGRMTDEEWKPLVYGEEHQDELEALRPAWYKHLLF